MSLELAFARDFVAWGNGHPRGAILLPGCAPGEEHSVVWSCVASMLSVGHGFFGVLCRGARGLG